MSKTDVTTSSAECVKLWSEQLYRDTTKEIYWQKFMGTGSDSVVNVKTSLEKKKGDRERFAIRMRLEGDGRTEGQVLEGYEQSLTTYTTDVTLGLLRQAVRDDGSMTRQRAMFDVTQESLDALKGWTAEKLDEEAFDAITDSPTKIFYGDGTSTASVTTSGVLTPTMISKMKTWCMTGGARSQTPLRPVKVDGKNYFILVVHPDVAYSLKADSTTTINWNLLQREANDRGKTNPIFTGALGVLDGVVIHEHEDVPIVTNWGAGANVPGAQCFMMGAQALIWAWGERPTIVKKKFDYDEEDAVAMRTIFAVAKPVFNSLDYGSVGCYVARTQVSDA